MLLPCRTGTTFPLDTLKRRAQVLLAGRSFSWHDDENAPAVAVVNRHFANKMFGSVNKAVGAFYKLQDGTRVEVVGVVEDGKYMSLDGKSAVRDVPAIHADRLRVMRCWSCARRAILDSFLRR